MKAEIVSFEEFAKIRSEKNLGKIVSTSGGFDPVHTGHLYGMHESKKLGNTMVVIVNGDNFLRSKKGKPFIFHKERCEIISYIKGVDFVIPYETTSDHTCIVALQKLRPHVFTKSGNDRLNRETIPEWDTCKELGIEVVVIPPAPSDIVHSSQYLKRWFNAQLKLKLKFIVNPYNKIYFFISNRFTEKYSHYKKYFKKFKI